MKGFGGLKFLHLKDPLERTIWPSSIEWMLIPFKDLTKLNFYIYYLSQRNALILLVLGALYTFVRSIFWPSGQAFGRQYIDTFCYHVFFPIYLLNFGYLILFYANGGWRINPIEEPINKKPYLIFLMALFVFSAMGSIFWCADTLGNAAFGQLGRNFFDVAFLVLLTIPAIPIFAGMVPIGLGGLVLGAFMIIPRPKS